MKSALAKYLMKTKKGGEKLLKGAKDKAEDLAAEAIAGGAKGAAYAEAIGKTAAKEAGKTASKHPGKVAAGSALAGYLAGKSSDDDDDDKKKRRRKRYLREDD